MPNTSQKRKDAQNINSYLKIKSNLRIDRGNVISLIKKLKESKKKKNNEKFIFLASTISILIISGIIISF
tara:strand:+ start:115 stop:324 length:210 start_codon:yes stop_codon:yes gene_type:complete